MQLVRRGKDPANGLAVQLRFRQKASLLRVTGTVGLVEDLIDNERQVAVSVQFLETADALCEQLQAKGITVARIDGSMSADEREVDRIAFQTGDAQAIVFTVTEGVSLHAGEVAAGANMIERAMIIHDIRYSALDQHQIEGRTHRDGQNAIAYYAFAEGTIEEQIVSRTIDRLSDMATMLGDDTTWVAEMTALLDGFIDDDVEMTLFRD
jgi:SNF2 family DNA or RNA helicase